MSLTVHERVRAISTVIGVSSSLYRRWRRQQGTVVFVPDAAVRLPALARRVAELEERRRALRAGRDAALAVMLTDGWRNKQVARMIGRDATRVGQLSKEIFGSPVVPQGCATNT